MRVKLHGLNHELLIQDTIYDEYVDARALRSNGLVWFLPECGAFRSPGSSSAGPRRRHSASGNWAATASLLYSDETTRTQWQL